MLVVPDEKEGKFLGNSVWQGVELIYVIIWAYRSEERMRL